MIADDTSREITDQLRGLEAGLAKRVLGVFLLDASGRLNALREAIGRRDFKGVYEAAHSMQGSASMVGAVTLADQCRRVAEAAGVGEIDACERLANELGGAFTAREGAKFTEL